MMEGVGGTAEEERGGREQVGGAASGGNWLHGLGDGQAGGYRWRTHDPRKVPAEELRLTEEVARTMRSRVTLVWKECSEGWEKHVVIAESACLRAERTRGGADGEGGGGETSGRGGEMGLYVWKNVRKERSMGRYGGTTVGKEFRDGDPTAQGRSYAEVERRGLRNVVQMGADGHGRSKLVDGEKMGAPFLQAANDARGLTTAEGRPRENTAKMEGRSGSLTMRVNKEGLGGGGVEVGWEGMENQEILWSYGQGYWAKWGHAEMCEATAQARQKQRGRRKEREQAWKESGEKERLRQEGRERRDRDAREGRAAARQGEGR